MKPAHSNARIVYYTHPLCPVSWRMQENWREFISAFGHLASFKFCMATWKAEDQNPGADGKTAYVKASQAVKAASLQSQWAAHFYLDALRNAAMAEQRDISQVNVLVDIAREVSRAHRNVFDLQRFGEDFNSPATRRALHDDELKIRVNKVEHIPTITFTVDGKGIKATGLVTTEELKRMLGRITMPVSTNWSSGKSVNQ